MSVCVVNSWREIIAEIQCAEQSLPSDDIWAVAAGRDLADLIHDLQDALSPHQRTKLVGIAAAIMRRSHTEIMAALQADLELKRAAVY